MRRWVIPVTTGALAAALLSASGASARTFDVTRTGDTAPNGCGQGGCTLREAIIAANARPGADEVELRSGRTYTLALAGSFEDAAATGDLDITGPLEIHASNARKRATVDANDIDRVFHVQARTSFHSITITDGDAPGIQGDDDGGGIYAWDPVTLVRSRVTANDAADDGQGIQGETGSLTLVRSAVTGNFGHGIRQEGDGGISLRHTRVAGNVEEGIQESDAGDVRVKRSVLAGNDQGGIVEFGDGAVSVVRSVVRDSQEAGVQENETGDLILKRARLLNNGLVGAEDTGPGSLRVVGSTAAGNDNGGLATFGGDRGRISKTTVSDNTKPASGAGIFDGSDQGLVITGSTISGNTSLDSGGGIWTGTPVTIVNSTLSGNRAALSGGGIRADGPSAQIRLNAVTIVRNVANYNDTSTNAAGGGINANNGASYVGTRNTLVALNRADFGAAFPDCSADIDSAGHNLLGDDDGCSGIIASDLIRAKPKSAGSATTAARPRRSP